MDNKYGYEELVDIIRKLRSKDGCPWDIEQTHQSLIPGLLEESYELIEALKENDTELMQEELGDVLLQVLMQSQIASELNEFTMDDVIDGISKKLVYRHPHVFKGVDVKDSKEVLKNWEELKKVEKNEKTITESMERVAKTLPSPIRAQKIYKKSLKDNDNKDSIETTLKDLSDRVCSLQNDSTGLVFEEKEKIIGELLFDIVKLSTFFDINAEFALTNHIEKFINRFRYVENSRVNRD